MKVSLHLRMRTEKGIYEFLETAISHNDGSCSFRFARFVHFGISFRMISQLKFSMSKKVLMVV